MGTLLEDALVQVGACDLLHDHVVRLVVFEDVMHACDVACLREIEDELTTRQPLTGFLTRFLLLGADLHDEFLACGPLHRAAQLHAPVHRRHHLGAQDVVGGKSAHPAHGPPRPRHQVGGQCLHLQRKLAAEVAARREAAGGAANRESKMFLRRRVCILRRAGDRAFLAQDPLQRLGLAREELVPTEGTTGEARATREEGGLRWR
mmetsp:Transcript_47841/g.154164  ORF Transcript_47841/g.154164 Transcript_47841/m.154164 type:complete len:205 (-) Transcript_47841:509-1123(-)